MTGKSQLLRFTFGLMVPLLALLSLGACNLTEPDLSLDQSAVANQTIHTRSVVVPTQGTYRIQAGDTLSVYVFDNPEISRDVTVAPDGRISYPLAGSFMAEGRTLSQTRSILATRFSDNIVAPQVTVSLAAEGAYSVFVSGEVLQPGELVLQKPTTLVQAITRAGGFTAFAKKDRILIYNPETLGGSRRIFDYDKFVADPEQQDLLLKPGDTIIVL